MTDLEIIVKALREQLVFLHGDTFDFASQLADRIEQAARLREEMLWGKDG